jgi:hypothetical protein
MQTPVSDTTTPTIGNRLDDAYHGYLVRLQARLWANTAAGTAPLFTTAIDGEDLWLLYLNSFTDPAERQYHNCSCCRHFIEHFGNLVTIAPDGTTDSALWHEGDAPEAYKHAVSRLARAVRRAAVDGVFLSSKLVWGHPETGPWRHLAVIPPPALIFKHNLLSAHQAACARREDFKSVSRSLHEIPPAHAEAALRLLESDALYRGEKVIGPVRWFRDLHVARDAAQGNGKANVVWLAVAKAPAGFCNPRDGMTGSLFEDLAAGKTYEELAASFRAKMAPTRYQRPQAPPSAGAVDAAEKIVAQLQAAGSLARRYARHDEIKALWRPRMATQRPEDGTVFGHLKPGNKPQAPVVLIPQKTLTWVKFEKTVLPHAERIEIYAPPHAAYFALTTAVNPDAPPIIQWDHPEARNPVAWYTKTGGSYAGEFNVQGGGYVEVSAVTLRPSTWQPGFDHQGMGVLFVIAGARDTQPATACLFPEILKSEFHGIRAVIEAYSKNARLEGGDGPQVAGLMPVKGQQWDIRLRVHSGGHSSEYRLDRWD